jgi:hypothetical protein
VDWPRLLACASATAACSDETVSALLLSRLIGASSLLLRRRAAPSEPRNDTYEKKGRTPKHEEDLHIDGTRGEPVLSSTPFGS